jgi:formate dehydrogenase iron-sulfur subunit
MSLDRRQFIKLAGVGMGGLLLSSQDAGISRAQGARDDVAILYDTAKCIGCRACQEACREWNGTPAQIVESGGLYDTPSELSGETWTLIKLARPDTEWPFINYQCQHCTDAACVNVCPTGALFHDERGFVSLDQEKCNGCGYCTQFCPYGVPGLTDTGLVAIEASPRQRPRYLQSTSAAGGTGGNLLTGEAIAGKCTFCQDRLNGGIGGPFCVERCPTGALTWGNRNNLLEQARARISELKSQGFDGAQLYGENEAGGLHRLSILLDEPSRYGIPADPRPPIVFGAVWQRVIQPLGGIAVGATALGLMINWLVARTQIKAEEV